MISLDTETTGLDPWHGAKPFLITICNKAGEVTYWEWDVDPITRQPQIPQQDLKEVRQAINNQEIVMQNAKFDVRMLETIGVTDWPWERTYDTLLCSHLLDSSKPKDLTYSVLHYLGVDIKQYDENSRAIVLAARRIAKRDYPKWRIADSGLEDMPSAKGTVWKHDLWLPRALAKAEEYPDDYEGWSSTSTYANIDSETTLLLFKEQERLLKQRGLWKLYEQRRKVLPIAYKMEKIGVTLSDERLTELEGRFLVESNKSNRVCVGIAKRQGYELQLPKSGNNKSLTEFVFGHLKLPVVSKSKKTGAPSLNKAVLQSYIETLDKETREWRFITNLVNKRKRDTALSYMEGYRRFMLPRNKIMVLHPSLNPVGSHTLRWSSSNPNEQNISKQEGLNLRYAFGPAPGREWWALDYNNLELRIPAYECKEPAMLALFEHPNDAPYFGSYHLLIFDILYPDLFKKYGVEVKNKYKSTKYGWTKNGNFAELYGAVDTNDGKSTADRAFHYPGAQSIVARKLKKKAALNHYWIDHARKYGYVETMPDKTVDPSKGYPLKTPRTRWGSISPTIPLNYHVQGTACWVMMQAMIKVQEYLTTFPGHFMVMQVHDELVFDFPYKKGKGNRGKINKIRRLMESCGDDVGVPLTCGVDYHPNNWSEAK